MKIYIKRTIISILALCGLLGYSSVNAQVSDTNQLCLDILNEETSKIQGENYTSIAPKSFEDDIEKKSLGLRPYAFDFMFDQAYDRDVFAYKAVDFGPRLSFKMSEALPYVKYLEKITGTEYENNKEPNVHLYDAMFYYLKGEKDPIYCRTRTINIVKGGEALETLVAMKVGMANVAESMSEIKKTSVNGKNFKTVLLDKPVYSNANPSEVLYWRRELYVIPENINGKYDVYNLIDDYEKVLTDYVEWKKQAKVILNNPKMFTISYFNGIEKRIGKEVVWGLRPMSYGGNINAGGFLFVQYELLKHMLERDNSLAFNFFKIKLKEFEDSEKQEQSSNNWLNFMYKRVNFENVDFSLIETQPIILNSYFLEKMAEGEALRYNIDPQKYDAVRMFAEIRREKERLGLDKEVTGDFIDAVKGTSVEKKKEKVESEVSVAVLSGSIIGLILVLVGILFVIKKRKSVI